MKNSVNLILLMSILLSGCSTENMMNPVTIGNIDLSLVKDGKWTGEYTDEKSAEMSKVQVDVANHRIISISVLQRKSTPIGIKGEYVIVRVIEQQSLQVDAISGATLTSTITLKAIENALRNGMDS